MSRNWERGSDRGWRRTRARILQLNLMRNDGRCQLQLPDVCTGYADCVHHVHGRAITGDDPDYLVAACTPCNLKVGAPQHARDPLPRPLTTWEGIDAL